MTTKKPLRDAARLRSQKFFFERSKQSTSDLIRPHRWRGQLLDTAQLMKALIKEAEDHLCSGARHREIDDIPCTQREADASDATKRSWPIPRSGNLGTVSLRTTTTPAPLGLSDASLIRMIITYHSTALILGRYRSIRAAHDHMVHVIHHINTIGHLKRVLRAPSYSTLSRNIRRLRLTPLTLSSLQLGS